MTGSKSTFTKAGASFSRMRLAALRLDKEPDAWLDTARLMSIITSNAREPLPESVLRHIEARLDGSARKRRGRSKPGSLQHIRTMLMISDFFRFELWLNARRKRRGLTGWSQIRSADWWQGAPSLRAARMVVRRYKPNCSPESVRNMAYEARRQWQHEDGHHKNSADLL